MKNIIFIGGVHGVGKGHICQIIKSNINIVHLTASDVLKWKDISAIDNKLVQDINETQDLLIVNLKKIVDKDKRYLLDGHYCLLNKNGESERVPFKTFEDLNLSKILIVFEDTKIIKQRLEIRDGKDYDLEQIKYFQNMEVEYAKEISRKLNLPLLEIQSSDYNQETLIEFIDENTTRH
ncbi:ATP-binding protein [Algoriella xinjiangensis]|uniref:ATP-binding protein n=1 Tax=Algoriella xinjiangensis TaxID=684065 RepID=UPI0015A5BF69|nr:ATP-binding protein [Algoriella xinjiangensis]